jgi:polyisoprenoid-binding protein YceI
MTVWNVEKNAEAKTMVITAEFKASITNVWQLWADPRLLERWWGPPGFPATFEHHDLTPGGTITYFMSGPDGGARFDGTWNVDTSIGTFSDVKDTSGNFVGYRIQEQLASIGANTAVGRTPKVTGSLMIAGTKVTTVDITADLTALQSDDNQRDNQLRNNGIQTNQFPSATFKLTSPIDLGSIPADGKEISATASGQLTLHGVTKDVQIALKAKLSGSTIVVTGSLPIVLADYSIDKPNSFKVLSIADNGTMELQLFFTHT